MNKPLSFSLFFIMLALAFTACKKDSGSDPSPSTNESGTNDGLTFLRVGATSIYDENSTFFDDTIYTVVESELAKDTFLVRNYTENTTVAPTTYLALTNGILSYSYRLRDKSSYQVLCKFNKPVGTSWQVYSNGSLYYTATIEAVNASIETGKGTLNDAVKVKCVTPSNSTTYQYYSKSAGVLSAGSGSETLYLRDYTNSNTPSSAPSQIPAITFGDFPFLSVGNYWNYYFSSYPTEDSLRLDVISKDSRNVYKVKLRFKSESSDRYEYWFEDNGYLMVYNEGETMQKADPIYMKPSAAQLNYGWVGYGTSSVFVYRISSLSSTATSTKYGSLPCMEIIVSSGLFSQQSNYWNESKGQVLASGLFITQDLNYSNVRHSSSESMFYPGLHL